MATIVILEHELQRDLARPYMIYAIAERWRALGHSVLVHHGLANPPDADLAVLNVDLTVIPEEYRALAARYPKVINGAVHDISKPRFSRLLVERASDWPGPVMVKTKTNFGGRPEQALRQRARQRELPCSIPQGPVLEDYALFRSLREVPDTVWRTPGLVVEKFVPEQDEHGYHIRIWIFLGDQGVGTRYRSRSPIAKGQTMFDRTEVPVPPEATRWREQLAMDFGKFDFVLHGGEFFLLDVNRTPAFPPSISAQGGKSMDILASGVRALLR